MNTTNKPAIVARAAHSEPPTGVTARRQAFRKMHEAGCFVIPNPWDVGSARYLQHLGFPALATTSAGSCVLTGAARFRGCTLPGT